jgi:hypothetical protein
VDLQIFVVLSCLEPEASISRESAIFPLNAPNPISLAWIRSLLHSLQNYSFFVRRYDPDLCRNTMKYRNTHKRRDAAEIRLHFINNK